MWIFVEPLDVWLFRDGKPFSAGEQSRATGMFPPLPTTFQGAVRTAALAAALEKAGLTFAQFNGRANAPESSEKILQQLWTRWGRGAGELGQLRLRGPFLARSGSAGLELFLPAPRDLVVVEDAGRRVGRVGALRRLGGAEVRGGLEAPARAAWPDLAVPWLEAAEGAEPPGILSVEQFRQYLLGEPVEVGDAAVAHDRLVKSDTRVGVQLDRVQGTVMHGRLYLAHFYRLAPGAGLAAEIRIESEEPPLPDRGWMALGGEARAAQYRKVGEPVLDPIEGNHFRRDLQTRLGQGRRFKLVLAAPAVFEGGWRPDFLHGPGFSGRLAGVPVKLVSAVVGKPVPVSGWDYANDRPKRLRWAVPAGSVYVLAVSEDEDRDRWVKTLLDGVHGRPLAQSHEDEAAGLGLAFVGAPPPEEGRRSAGV
jgi:CRISPR-associated protein Cmr3